MSSEEETLRIKILKSRLRRAQLQEEEAELEQIQRALALHDQEAEVEFNRQTRETQRKQIEADAVFERERKRPSFYIGTTILYDDVLQKWACWHQGVIAHGDTPEMACDNFDHLWVYGDETA